MKIENLKKLKKWDEIPVNTDKSVFVTEKVYKQIMKYYDNR